MLNSELATKVRNKILKSSSQFSESLSQPVVTAKEQTKCQL